MPGMKQIEGEKVRERFFDNHVFACAFGEAHDTGKPCFDALQDTPTDRPIDKDTTPKNESTKPSKIITPRQVTTSKHQAKSQFVVIIIIIIRLSRLVRVSYVCVVGSIERVCCWCY